MDQWSARNLRQPQRAATLGDVHYLYWLQGECKLSDTQMEELARQFGVQLRWKGLTAQQHTKALDGQQECLKQVLEDRRRAIQAGQINPEPETGAGHERGVRIEESRQWRRLPNCTAHPIYARRSSSANPDPDSDGGGDADG